MTIEFLPSVWISPEPDYSGPRGEYKAFHISFDRESYSAQELCEFFDNLHQVIKTRFGGEQYAMTFAKLAQIRDVFIGDTPISEEQIEKLKKEDNYHDNAYLITLFKPREFHDEEIGKE